MSVRGSAGVVYNEKIYFSSEYPVGCLYCFDIKEKTTQFIKQFSVDKKQGMCHRVALLYSNMAWFIPWDGCRVACVDLITMEERYFDISNHGYANGHAFADYIVYKEDELVLIPSGVDLTTLMIINMKTKHTQSYLDVIPSCKCIGAYIWEDILCFVSPDGEVFSEFDLKEKKIKSKNMEKKSKAGDYASLLRYKEWICLIPYSGSNVILMDLKTGSREKILLPHKQDAYWSGCIIKDGILLHPGNYNSNFLKLDLLSKKGTVIDWHKKCLSNDWVCLKEIFSNDKEHLVMGTDGFFYLFDEEGVLRKSWNYMIEVEDRLEKPKMNAGILSKFFLENGPIYENADLELKDLISVVLAE